MCCHLLCPPPAEGHLQCLFFLLSGQHCRAPVHTPPYTHVFAEGGSQEGIREHLQFQSVFIPAAKSPAPVCYRYSLAALRVEGLPDRWELSGLSNLSWLLSAADGLVGQGWGGGTFASYSFAFHSLRKFCFSKGRPRLHLVLGEVGPRLPSPTVSKGQTWTKCA